MKTTIIKQSNRSEPYSQHKLRASIYASCLSVRTPAGEAEITADRVCKDIVPWLERKLEMTSRDIRQQAGTYLHLYNPNAAYLYKTDGVIQ